MLWTSSPKFWRRHIVALAFVFFVGGLSIFAAIARFFVIYPQVRRDENASIVNTYELWALVEITASQMTVCLPALRVYLRNHKTKNVGQNWHARGNETSMRGRGCRTSKVGENGNESSSFQELWGGQKSQEEV